MKQYDFVRAWKDDADYDIEGPVILLTIEELRGVWQASRDRYWWEECSGSPFKDRPEPDFETYLTSKGINILP